MPWGRQAFDLRPTERGGWREALVAAHGVVGGLSSMVMGGSFISGFASGSVGHFVGGGKMVQSLGKVGKAITRTMAGGLAAMAGGGKFANGAVTAAAAYAFGEWTAQARQKELEPTADQVENDQFFESKGIVPGTEIEASQLDKPFLKKSLPVTSLFHQSFVKFILGKADWHIKYTTTVGGSQSVFQRFWTNFTGRYEVVVTPAGDDKYTVVTGRYGGTLNRGNNPLSHLVLDVAPHILFDRTRRW